VNRAGARVRSALCALAAAAALTASQPSLVAGQNIWDDLAFALYRQAATALEAKDYARAAALAQQAIAAYPEHVLAYYLVGQAALAQSQWDQASQALAKVAALYPRSASAQRDLGAAYQQLGRIDEAGQAYQAALAIRPDEETRARLAFMLANAGRVAQALPLLQMMADAGTTRPEVYLGLARIAYDRGDFQASASAFEKAAALRDNGRTWFNLGVVRVRLGQTPAALEAFEKAARHEDAREQALKEIQKITDGQRPARSSRPGLPR